MKRKRKRCDSAMSAELDTTNMICDFCKTTTNDEMKLGRKFVYQKFKVHYFCLLLSEKAYQTGEDEQGILGFMPKMITKVRRSCQRLVCCYCGEKNASLKCCIDGCAKKFHLPCGIKNFCITQFFGDFQTFCNEHGPTQIYTEEDRIYTMQTSKYESMCGICYENVIDEVNYHSIWAPCCRNGWFHRECILKFAHSAGYFFFKCPLCNNKDEFIKEMERMGIYIPKQDAAWELEPNAYHDLYVRYDRCDAEPCLCPTGRNTAGKSDSEWMLLLCELCGSSGMHKSCLEKKTESQNEKYRCDFCLRENGDRTRSLHTSSGISQNRSLALTKRYHPHTEANQLKKLPSENKESSCSSDNESDSFINVDEDSEEENISNDAVIPSKMIKVDEDYNTIQANCSNSKIGTINRSVKLDQNKKSQSIEPIQHLADVEQHQGSQIISSEIEQVSYDTFIEPKLIHSSTIKPDKTCSDITESSNNHINATQNDNEEQNKNNLKITVASNIIQESLAQEKNNFVQSGAGTFELKADDSNPVSPETKSRNEEKIKTQVDQMISEDSIQFDTVSQMNVSSPHKLINFSHEGLMNVQETPEEDFPCIIMTTAEIHNTPQSSPFTIDITLQNKAVEAENVLPETILISPLQKSDVQKNKTSPAITSAKSKKYSNSSSKLSYINSPNNSMAHKKKATLSSNACKNKTESSETMNSSDRRKAFAKLFNMEAEMLRKKYLEENEPKPSKPHSPDLFSPDNNTMCHVKQSVNVNKANDNINKNIIDVIGDHPADRMRLRFTSDLRLKRRKVVDANKPRYEDISKKNMKDNFAIPIWKQRMIETRSKIKDDVRVEDKSENSTNEVIYEVSDEELVKEISHIDCTNIQNRDVLIVEENVNEANINVGLHSDRNNVNINISKAAVERHIFKEKEIPVKPQSELDKSYVERNAGLTKEDNLSEKNINDNKNLDAQIACDNKNNSQVPSNIKYPSKEKSLELPQVKMVESDQKSITKNLHSSQVAGPSNIHYSPKNSKIRQTKFIDEACENDKALDNILHVPGNNLIQGGLNYNSESKCKHPANFLEFMSNNPRHSTQNAFDEIESNIAKDLIDNNGTKSNINKFKAAIKSLKDRSRSNNALNIESDIKKASNIPINSLDLKDNSKYEKALQIYRETKAKFMESKDNYLKAKFEYNKRKAAYECAEKIFLQEILEIKYAEMRKRSSK